VKKLSQRELDGYHGKTSWHDEYKDSAWIFVGGMPYDLSEGDVLTVFSQWGEIVNINMVRDKATGKFKGFGFICYENQKSTVLAVDNFNGIQILGRTIRVDHVKDYKPPKDSDKLDDITRQLYEEGCAPKIAEESAPKVVDGYELLEEEEDERDDGLGTHSVLKGLADSSRSRDISQIPSETANGRHKKHRVEEERTHRSKSDSVKESDPSRSLKRGHKAKKSKKKHSRGKDKDVKKQKKKKHRRRSSSESSSSDDSDSSDSDTDSSPDSRRKSSKRDSSPHSKKRRRGK
jgi:RNA-binding motif X-linked protein 2